MPGLTMSRVGSIALALVALTGIPAAGVAQEDVQAVVAFADGVRAFNEQRYPDADDRFGFVLEREPRNGTARYWLGLTLLQLGRPGEALEQIEESLRSGPLQVDPLWVRHDLGAAQLAAGEAGAAAKTLAAVVVELEARLAKEEKSRARLARRAEKEKVRAKSEERREELEWEAEGRLQARQDEEALLARSLRRQGEALDRLGRADEAAAARTRAAALVPAGSLESAGTEIVAPAWGGELPAFAVAQPWELSVGLETVGDSNPSLLAEGLRLDTPDAGIDLVHGEEADQAAQINLRLLVNSTRSFGGWRLGAAVEARQSFYQDLDFFNVGELRGVGSMVLGGAPGGVLNGPLGAVHTAEDRGLRRLSLLFQGGVDQTLLDGSGYLTTAEGSASLVYRRSPLAAFQADLHLLNRSYREEPAVGRRSGSEVRLGLSQTYAWRAGPSLRLEVLGGERSAGLPFESRLLRGTADLSWPRLPGDLSLSLLGSWQKEDYVNKQSDLFFFVYNLLFPTFEPLKSDPTPRQDTTLRAAAAVSRPLRGRDLLLTARFAWIDRDSNLESRFATFDYSRTLVSLGASWLF